MQMHVCVYVLDRTCRMKYVANMAARCYVQMLERERALGHVTARIPDPLSNRKAGALVILADFCLK